jgi:hypothetical protein
LHGGIITVLVALVAVCCWRPAPAVAQAHPDSVMYSEVWTPTAGTSSIHLHGGLFLPLQATEPSPTIGMRLGKHVGSHLMMGLLGGWTRERKELKSADTDTPGIQPDTILARADAHVVPVMAFLQVNLTNKFFIVPYIGGGVGYEWLILEVNDFRDGRTASVTFSNWAYETYAGVGLQLARDLRIDGELFYNGASLERDIVDANGHPWKQAIDMNGVGARVGLDIVFGQ